jgi:hypothetical protein
MDKGMGKMIGRIALAAGIASCVLATALPSRAAVIWDLKPAGTGDWDWALRGLYEQYSNGQAFTFKGFNWGNAAGHCFEIATTPGRFIANPDTRIWAQKPDGTWMSINDDYNGTWQSKARIWVSYVHLVNNINQHDWEGYTFIEIRPYNSAGAYDDFGFSVTRRDLSEANCTNTTLPWVKFKGTGMFQYDLTWGNNT